MSRKKRELKIGIKNSFFVYALFEKVGKIWKLF
jgi:hypothetical protein